MGFFSRVGSAINNFYGGSSDEEGYDDEELEGEEDYENEENATDEDDESKDGSGFGNDGNNPDGFSGDEEQTGENEERQEAGDDSRAKEGKDDEDKELKVLQGRQLKGKSLKKRNSLEKEKKLEKSKMKVDSIVNGCGSKSAGKCPYCHKESIFKSRKVFDYVPLTAVSVAIGFPIYRFYCFNRKCQRSYFKGYAFNCRTPQFNEISVSLKRPFGTIN